jgi:hypothetical protein
MLSSKLSAVGRTSRPVYHGGKPRSPRERVPVPVWRERVKQREHDLPHRTMQLQRPKQGLNRTHAHLRLRVGEQT